MAQATSVDDLVARIEADGFFLRVDTTVAPTMSRGAMSAASSATASYLTAVRCPPIRYWDEPRDYLSSYLARMVHDHARAAHPAVVAWAKGTRLNPISGLGVHREHPLVVQTLDDLKQFGAAAAGNLVKLLQ
jgi:hypothetical protein